MEKINGLVLAKMIDLGARNLAKNAEKINSLNVFPVPDGDTGTNMNLSMSSGAKETAANTVENIGELGKSFSKGLLMGARGNSGVILSQLFRGMSQYIVDKKEIDSKEFAAAIQNGVSIAYKAIIKPVEGTILTVAREAAEAGVKKAESTTSVIEVMEAIYAEAQESLKRTPDLLPILKEVGVVDSGGQGLVCVYQGFVAALKGEEIDGLDAVETNIVDMQFEDNHDMDFMSPEDIVYGFCTEFTVRLDKDKKEFNEDQFRKDMSEFGDSLLVISDSEYVKIHVHTETPGNVFNYGQQYGELIKIKSDNMREQHREVLRKQESKQATTSKEVKEQMRQNDLKFKKLKECDRFKDEFKYRECIAGVQANKKPKNDPKKMGKIGKDDEDFAMSFFGNIPKPEININKIDKLQGTNKLSEEQIKKIERDGKRAINR